MQWWSLRKDRYVAEDQATPSATDVMFQMVASAGTGVALDHALRLTEAGALHAAMTDVARAIQDDNVYGVSAKFLRCNLCMHFRMLYCLIGFLGLKLPRLLIF